MPTNIEIKIVPFGQVRLEIGKPIPAVEERQAFPTIETVRYREPQETISRIYEVEYREIPTNYIVPLSTG
ncbi:MAG: hypothetical protein QMD80_02660 [archaeon]|nr:hypothetical protein [archaeon]MDI6885295.1 hypothetical protein [archaeon]